MFDYCCASKDNRLSNAKTQVKANCHLEKEILRMYFEMEKEAYFLMSALAQSAGLEIMWSLIDFAVDWASVSCGCDWKHVHPCVLSDKCRQLIVKSNQPSNDSR